LKLAKPTPIAIPNIALDHELNLGKHQMKLTVFRYKVWDQQHNDLAHIAPYYAIREFIEHLEGATVIEDDYLEVDESDLDTHGRIAVREKA
jgi:hypothetical protein